eukprot:TRINITY_DN5429_c0_g1_i1.p4 TRINITY_DN5429_c0_g1~~TRINITY_DN5429_c0_g1_i1.p4  ORF type:complete len:278 (-),score=34.48 TRINITY_DN5429_c0_g1_i1:1023-1856(-)
MVFEKQMYCASNNKIRRFTPLNFSKTFGSHVISIVEQNDRYDLRIDNQSFSHLYLEEKTKQNFKREAEVNPPPVKELPKKEGKPATGIFEMGKGFDFTEDGTKEPEGFSWEAAPKFKFGGGKKAEPASQKPNIFGSKPAPQKKPPVAHDLLPVDVLQEPAAPALPNDLIFDKTEPAPAKLPTGLDFLEEDVKVQQPEKKEEAKKSILDEDIDVLAGIVAPTGVQNHAPIPSQPEPEKPKGIPSFGSNKQAEPKKAQQDFFSDDFQFQFAITMNTVSL